MRKCPTLLRGQRRAGLTTVPNSKFGRIFPTLTNIRLIAIVKKLEKDDLSSEIGLPANS